MIKAEHLSKIYKIPKKKKDTLKNAFFSMFYREYENKIALNDVSFNINKGEFIGYIGPNGAGKSTTIKLLTGILTPSQGTIRVAGFDPHKERYEYTKNIGVVFGQRRLLSYDIPVIDSLRLYRSIYELSKKEFDKRITYFNKILGLDRYLHIPVRKLSLGERMRCEIAAALLHKPKIVFLDEPTIGLDQVAKDEIRKFLKEVNEKDKTTIILTTHDMGDIEELCKRVIVINEGKKIYDGNIEILKQMIMTEKTIDITINNVSNNDALQSLIRKQGIIIVEQNNTFLSIRLDTTKQSVPSVVKEIFQYVDIEDLTIREPRLEHIIKKIYEKK